MLTDFSNQIADIVTAASPSIVQVRGGGRAASGVVYAPGRVLTTARAVGRDDHPEVITADGQALASSIVGWDPATRLVLLHADGCEARPLTPAPLPRVGNLAIAIGRSLSNGVTATIGLVSIVGGPLRTGPRRQIEQVFRMSAPTHEGFAGGAVLGADGSLIGIATAAAIRGLDVVIPASIAWPAAAAMTERVALKRGYLGIVAQPVRVPERQRAGGIPERALLVTAVSDGSPAAQAGILVGDLVFALDQASLGSPEDLLDLLVGDRVGRAAVLRLLRGGTVIEVTVTPAERK